MSEQRIISYKIELDDAPIKSLKQQLREATMEAQRLATAEVIDQAALEAAVQKTAELKDAMEDVNEQVAVFASGSKYEQASNALGQVKQAIFSLDFEKAQERAGAFANVAKNINFGDAIKSALQMGQTFLTLGKALLTNPIFILAAVIVGIVVVVYKLLDSLGFIQSALDALREVVQNTIDLFYALTDAIGITSKAEEKAAEEQNARLATQTSNRRKAIDNQIRQNEYLQNSINETFDFEIAKAQAAGKDTFELEKQKRAEYRKTLEEQIKLLEQSLIANAGNFEAQWDILKQMAAKRKEITKSEQDDEVAFIKNTTSLRKAASKTNIDIAKNEQAKKDKLAKEEEDKEKLRIEKRRMFEDLMFANIEDADLRQEMQRKAKFKREEEDLIAKFGKDTALLFELKEKQRLEVEAFDDQIKLKEQERLANMNALQLQYNAMLVGKDDFQAKLDLKQAEYTEEQRLLKEKLDAEAITQEEYNLRIKMGEEQFAADITAIKKDQADKEAENVKKLVDWEIAQRTYLQDTVSGIANETVDLLKAVGGKSKGVALAALAMEKGAAIANVVINTMKELSANAVTSALNPANAVTFGGAGAAQLLKMNAVSKIRAGFRIATIAATGISGAKSISAGGGGGGVGGGGGGGGTPPISASMGQPQQTPQINMFQNNANNQPLSGFNTVTVVDYTDIENTGNRVRVLQNAVSLG